MKSPIFTNINIANKDINIAALLNQAAHEHFNSKNAADHINCGLNDKQNIFFDNFSDIESMRLYFSLITVEELNYFLVDFKHTFYNKEHDEIIKTSLKDLTSEQISAICADNHDAILETIHNAAVKVFENKKCDVLKALVKHYEPRYLKYLVERATPKILKKD